MTLELNGTTGVSAVQAGAVESGDLPAGSVIQVVQETTNVPVTVASTSLVDVEPSVTITPLSSNNKILIFHTAGGIVQGNTRDINFVLKRNGISVWQALRYGYVNNSASNEWESVPFNFSYLDLPSTTSPVEYNFAIRSEDSASLRHNPADVGEFSEATTIAMEIAG